MKTLLGFRDKRGKVSETDKDIRWENGQLFIDTNIVKHNYCVMKNVTITLDEDLARWARIRAAELDTSVSRLVAQLLREKMVSTKSFDSVMERYLAQKPTKLKRSGSKYPRRQELHER